MPTILMIMGWRLFFYSNEGNEPVHVHCRKGDKECKYWLDTEMFDLEEAYSYNMTIRGRLRRLYSSILSILMSNGESSNGGRGNEKLS